MNPAEGNILVACIGNMFLGDDAFGVEMARELESVQLPPEVVVADYGINGFDLAFALLEPWHAIILVDAVARGGAPGDLYLLQCEMGESEACTIDPHSIDPYRVLAWARSLGEIRAPVYVLGCEPSRIDDGFDEDIGLSGPVYAAMPTAVRMLKNWIDELARQTTAVASSRSVTSLSEEI